MMLNDSEYPRYTEKEEWDALVTAGKKHPLMILPLALLNLKNASNNETKETFPNM